MAQRFEFIRAEVLARLEAGQFVPVRRSKSPKISTINDTLLAREDRRNDLSPLAITKQCIRYEPRVFTDRKDLVLKLAKDLNHPDIKIIMLQGDQGSGKTSLVRGTIELMGGTHEHSKPSQLLWFDANRYTDFNEITQFLIQYIAYLGEQQNTFKAPQLSPNAQLSKILDAMEDVPLLIVLDNMEYLVNSQLQLNSPPFKEMLNFLLQFNNIKIMMLGERLPYKDLAPNLLPSKNASQAFSLSKSNESPHLDEIKLYGLSEKTTSQWLLERAKIELPPVQNRQLHKLTQGYPWLLKTLLYLNQKAGFPFSSLLEQLGQNEPTEALTKLIYEGLSPIHRQCVLLMVLVRHPLNNHTLEKMLPACFPGYPDTQKAVAQMEQSLLRPVLKVNYAPQDVLHHIQTQQARLKAGQSLQAFLPAYDLYHVFKKIMYRLMSPFERLRLHEALHDFYAQENAKAATNPDSILDKKSCVTEANFHLQMARKTDTSSVSTTLPLIDSPVSSSYSQAQAYQSSLDQHKIEPLKPRHSLDEYRNIVIREEGSEPSMALVEYSTQHDADDVEWENLLTPEEKRLLGLTAEDFTRSSTGQLEISKPIETLESLAIQSSPTPAEYEHDEQLKQIQNRLTLAVANRNKTELLRQLIALSEYWMTKHQWSRAEECLQKALTIEGQQFEDQEVPPPIDLLAQAWYQRGLLFQRQYKLPDALTCFQQAYQRLDNTSILPVPSTLHHLSGLICQKLADSYSFLNNLEQALTWQEKMVFHIEQAAQQDDDSTPEDQSLLRQMLSEGHFKDGQLLDETGKAQEAILAYERSIRENQGNNPEALAAAFSNIGQLQAEQGNFEQAIHYLNQSLAYDKQSGQEDIFIKSLETIALIYEEWADTLSEEEKTEQAQSCLAQAESLFQEALSIATRYRYQDQRQIQHPWHDHPNIVLSNLYLTLGHFYQRQSLQEKALVAYLESRSIGLTVLSNSSLQYLDECIDNLKSA